MILDHSEALKPYPLDVGDKVVQCLLDVRSADAHVPAIPKEDFTDSSWIFLGCPPILRSSVR